MSDLENKTTNNSNFNQENQLTNSIENLNLDTNISKNKKGENPGSKFNQENQLVDSIENLNLDTDISTEELEQAKKDGSSQKKPHKVNISKQQE